MSHFADITSEGWLKARHGGGSGGHHALTLKKEGQEIGTLRIKSHVGGHDLCGAILQRHGCCLSGRHAADQIIHGKVEQGFQDVKLVHVVPVEGPFADIGTFGDFLDGTGIYPPAIENKQGCVQQSLACFGGPS